jgi:alpha-L-fucosidase
MGVCLCVTGGVLYRAGMKRTAEIIATLVIVATHATAGPGISVTETRLESGNSRIDVVDSARGVKTSYAINLSDHHHPATGPDDARIKRFTSWGFGAFLCYNSNQYSGTEFCRSKDPVKDFKPASLDVRQWVRTIKDAGMRYAVLTARHTSEFLLWDSATSDCDSMTAIGRDIVAEYVRESRRKDIAPGIYYCLWGQRWRPNPNARAIILAQLHELATNYGPIPYFWLDMPHQTRWLAKDLGHQELYDMLRNINPECVIILNNNIQDGSVVRAFPTDVINGEMCAPPAAGHEPCRTLGGKRYYIPFEYEPCSQQRGTHNNGKWDFPGASWFTYGGGKPFQPSSSLSAEFLYRRIRRARDRGAANVLLSCAPDHTGRFREEDAKELVRLGRMLEDPSLAPPRPLTFGCKAEASGAWDANYSADRAFDDDPGTRWGGAPDTKSGWLTADLGEPKKFSRITISEGWDRVRRFEVQIREGDAWKTIHRGTTVGTDYSADFTPVTARHVRLNIVEATDVPTIWEVGLDAR